MALKLNFSKTVPNKVEAVVVFVGADRKLGAAAAKIDQAAGGLISHHLKKQPKFTGKKDQILTLTAPAKGLAAIKIFVIGSGDTNTASVDATGGKLYAALSHAGVGSVAVLMDSYAASTSKTKSEDSAVVTAHIALGMKLRSYRFDTYKSNADDKGELKTITLVSDAPAPAKATYANLDALAQGVFLTRDLANEPANVLYPASFAARIRDELQPLGVRVEIFDEKRLKKLGFGTHLAVGKGSTRPPRLVVMQWPGKSGAKKTKPLALVGKGITFDSGGYSLKSGGMEDMKYDMCGAAAVVGTFKTLALRRSKAHVVGVVGLAENMVSGEAMRPGDIYKSLSGKTVEVINTDAEGRLVLCDALTYVQRTYDPKTIIDIATLSGAMTMIFGSEYAGAFVNDEALWRALDDAGKATGEKLWRLPLDEVYRRATDGSTSDLRNIGGTREGGACTAAGYLEKFIDDGRPWAHLDIAGTAWTKSDRPTAPKPIPGYGVQLLDRLIAGHYE